LELESEALVVQLILNGKVEKALELLARHYKVDLPKIRVGLPKGRRANVFGCYAARNQTIYVLNSEVLKDPFVVLHEFYHHLRTGVNNKHKGTEKLANRFAKEFIEAYRFPKIHYTYTYTVKNQEPSHDARP
jgi:Zn-dependent peptidase ImmA (M78 family)